MGITVVSFLWHGDRWTKDDNGVHYVNTLFNSVLRNLRSLDRFVCFTNESGGFDSRIERRKLDPPEWKGCLPKICMFSPDAGLTGQVLSLDIDIIITGSLDHMAQYDGEFAVRSKFAKGLEHLGDGDIIGFKPEKCFDIWHTFKKNHRNIAKDTGGRERLYYRQVRPNADRWQIMYPGQIKGYKVDIRKTGVLPKDTRIVSCCGRPRPHELKHDWAVANWK